MQTRSQEERVFIFFRGSLVFLLSTPVDAIVCTNQSVVMLASAIREFYEREKGIKVVRMRTHYK